MINVKRINNENWLEAISMTSGPVVNAPFEEEWTMSAAYSILQATYERESDCVLLVDDDKIIGFIFYGWHKDKKSPLLRRYVIDSRYQGKGYGQAALPRVAEFLCNLYDSDTLYLTLNPENKRALHISEKFGFRATGDSEFGEAVYVWER